ncbi:uncharacterized protein LOC131651098 [Vicia villosa]|uniref:uncharacterized protein LOC131651098 n=1 Tax=Vicia villosa TaxID=3911 RepID=UPI00273B8AC9|nr:uncharacterized protein LOC131651098 [Vicia villosa]
MIVSWNIRGLNKVGKLREISSHLLNFQAEIIILLETRVKKNNVKAIRERLQWKGSFLDNYDHHANGRIWVYWDNNKVDIRHVKSSEQYIHCGVYDLMGRFKFWLTAIYALNQLEHRKILWKQMINPQRQLTGAWCAMGDFNNVANANGRIGGNLVVETEYVDYNEMLSTIGLCEVDSKGDFFTWSNKQSGNPIYSRIDRVIANVEWLQANDNLQLNVLSPPISDHSLLSLSDPIKPKQNMRPFRFSNNWIAIEDFHDIVKASWDKPISGRPMEILWKKLARLQPVLRRLNKPMNDIHLKIAEARSNLELAQQDLRNHQMDAHHMERVKTCTDELIRWNDMEVTSLRQRTKLNWIKIGDDNNTYFQAYLKARHNHKSIQFLQRDDGSIVTSQEDIEAEFLRLYGNLMGSANMTIQHIDIDAMRRGKQLNNEQRDYLISRVTTEEIKEALQGIGDLKSPGVDGYGANFFKDCWLIVREDVTLAIQEFFTYGRILKNFTRASVTLILKDQRC